MPAGERRSSPAPAGVWSPGKVLALLVAGALTAVVLLAGLGLAIYYAIDPLPAAGKGVDSSDP